MGVNKRLVIFVTGLSGAGKTTALSVFNDISYYSVDNIPLFLIEQFLNTLPDDNKPVSIGVNMQTIDFSVHALLKLITDYRQHYDVRLLFLKANSNTIHKRYMLTSMTHPLCADGNLNKAIKMEYEIYAPIIEAASLLIETDEIGPKELKRQLMSAFYPVNKHSKPMLIITSFGFKYGVPRDAETIFDARILNNPHWHKDLAKLTGQDQKVIDFLQKDTKTGLYVQSIIDYINQSIIPFLDNNKSFYHIAIGCTGGRHRSVYSSEKVYHYLKKNEVRCQIEHRNL